jgi:hypothetical protein
MPTKYLLVDDEPETLGLLQDRLPGIDVQFQSPVHLEEMIAKIQGWLVGIGHDQPCGLLLDWRLRAGGGGGAPAKVPSAATIAQELRASAAEGVTRSVPIIIVSSLERLAPTWNADETGHDLFDAQILKDRLSEESYREHARSRAIAFAEGYSVIHTSLNEGFTALGTLLQWPEHGTPPVEFDSRIQADFEVGDSLAVPHAADSPSPEGTIALDRSRPVHEYARFLVRELLDVPGPLIDENRVAAMMGVDRRSSGSSDWMTLVEEIFNAGRYRGPFSGAFPRWWSSWIEHWWRTTVDDERRSPRAYDAPSRVERIRARTRLDRLQAAEPIEPGYSRRYTTICEVLRRPLDPVNGLRLSTREPKAWQATRFASELAVRERLHRASWRIHPSDSQRAEVLQRPQPAA